ncbi:MAG: hypothetical protein LBQ88_12465 [Treponema sp.]|jgi:hypothetical protein|nr:hypothetical protein [Treponema sp.]
MSMINEPFFISAYKEWSRYRRFGLPHGQGYMREKNLYVRVIELFEQEFNDFQYKGVK